MNFKTLLLATTTLLLISFTQDEGKLITKTGHIKFNSNIVGHEFEANNYAVTSSLNKSNGDIVFSVPMQSFEFENAKMQQHFNEEKHLDTKQHPKSKFKGNISNISSVKFNVDSTYIVSVSGDLTLHGTTNNVSYPATIVISEGKVTANTVFKVNLKQYGIIESSDHIAQDILVTVNMKY